MVSYAATLSKYISRERTGEKIIHTASCFYKMVTESTKLDYHYYYCYYYCYYSYYYLSI